MLQESKDTAQSRSQSSFFCLQITGILVSKYAVGKGLFFAMADVSNVQRCQYCDPEKVQERVQGAVLKLKEREESRRKEGKEESGGQAAPISDAARSNKGNNAAVLREFDHLLHLADASATRKQEEYSAAEGGGVLCRANIGVALDFSPTVEGDYPQTNKSGKNQQNNPHQPPTPSLNKLWHCGDQVELHCTRSPVNGTTMVLALKIIKRNDGWSYVAPPPPKALPDCLLKLTAEGENVEKVCEKVEGETENAKSDSNTKAQEKDNICLDDSAVTKERRKLRLRRNHEVAKRVLDSYYSGQNQSQGGEPSEEEEGHEQHSSSDDSDVEAGEAEGDEKKTEKSRKWAAGNYRKGKAPKSHRAALFADFVQSTLLPHAASANSSNPMTSAPATAGGSSTEETHHFQHIVDVAGGKGYVAAALIDPPSKSTGSSGGREFLVPRQTRCTVIDPWPRGPLEKLVSESEGRCASLKACLDDEFVASPEGQELFHSAAAVVGMHPDQATEPIVDVGMKYRLPFAVVPCCVYPSENTHRRLPEIEGGGPVETTPQFVIYLKAKIQAWMNEEEEKQKQEGDQKHEQQEGMKKYPSVADRSPGTLIDCHLGFGGRDRVVGWIPSTVSEAAKVVGGIAE